jgi:molybdopterin/thiamine biosynthesis adenylyltransferase/uncharacterized protein (DUF433 family)
MNPKLSSTVSVVKVNDNILEFFKSNTRQQVRIKVEDDTILNIVLSLDGEKSLEELATEYDIEKEDMEHLIVYLSNNGILDNVQNKSDFCDYVKFRRIIHFISEYSTSHMQLVEMWNNIINSTVLIIGLGAVGTWVACNLAQSGVRNIILMDADKVDETNLHRQYGYYPSDVGQYKVDVLEKRLKEYNNDIIVENKKIYLDDAVLNCFDEYKLDLIINCADKPNVDTTSLWVGEYSMKRGIPHIIGGGYNLHLSLIGQTVLPFKTACVKCFQKTLDEENTIDSNIVKKLQVKNRKVGSFAPMCSLIASMVGMEAIKILSKNIEPANVNRRGEFDIYSMDIKYKSYEKRDDCEWCGRQGKYSNI